MRNRLTVAMVTIWMVLASSGLGGVPGLGHTIVGAVSARRSAEGGRVVAAGDVTVAPASLTFADRPVGTGSAFQAVTLTNTGTATIQGATFNLSSIMPNFLADTPAFGQEYCQYAMAANF